MVSEFLLGLSWLQWMETDGGEDTQDDRVKIMMTDSNKGKKHDQPGDDDKWASLKTKRLVFRSQTWTRVGGVEGP